MKSAALLALFAAQLASAADLYPIKPDAFNSRGPKPAVAFSFRQAECLAGPFQEDRVGTLKLTRSPTDTNCPVRANADGTYLNAKVGVEKSISVPRSINSLVSGELNTAFSAFGVTVPPSNKQITIEMWVTPKSILGTNTTYFLEVGALSEVNYSNDVGLADEEYQLRLSYRSTTGFSLEFVYHEDATNVGFATHTFGTAVVTNAIAAMSTNLHTPFYLAFTIDGSTSPAQSMIYIGKRGEALVSLSGAGGGITAGFIFPSTSVLRVGTSRLPSGNAHISFPGEVNFVAFHTTALTATQINTAFLAGLPNSNPVPQSAYTITVDDGAKRAASLAAVKYYDADGNALSQFKIIELPDKGQLFYDASVTAVTENQVIANAALLKFTPANTHEFSCATAPCAATYTTFKAEVSDGLCTTEATCFSPTPVTVTVRVVDVHAKPVVTAATLADKLKTDSNIVFNIEATDADDIFSNPGNVESGSRLHDDEDGKLTAGATVTFLDVESNGNALMEVDAATGACTTTPVVVNTPYAWGTYSAVTHFKFCFADNTHQSSAFRFTVSDKAGVASEVGTLRFKEPLEACSNSLTALGGDAVCASSGLETATGKAEELIPVFLQGTDSTNRPITYMVTELPQRGALYLNSGSAGTLAKGAAVTLETPIDGAVDSSNPNLVFVGQADYFTRASAGVYANAAGVRFNGCAASATNGCPVTFRFVAKAGESTSQPAAYAVHISSQPSALVVTATADEQSPARNASAALAGIAVTELDQGAYKIGVKVSTTVTGTLSLVGLTVPELAALSPGAECGYLVNCQPMMSFSGYPAQVNAALAKLHLVYDAGFANETHNVVVNVYAGANFAGPISASKTVGLKLADPAPPATGGSSSDKDDDSTTSAIIGGVVGGVLGCCLLVLLLVLCCCRKRRGAAAHKDEKDIEAGSKPGALAALKPESPKAAAAPVAGAKPAAAAAAAGGEEESVFAWEKHIDQRTGDVYFFNPKTGQSQWDPPTIKGKTGK